jgi:regulation of enolase protein 1 (concanavalin A-like superfamily)
MALFEYKQNGFFRQWRLAPNAHIPVDGWTEAISVGNAGLKFPITLRLTRRGETITPEISTDGGKTFRANRPITFSPPLAKTLYVGLAACSGIRGQLGTARFRDVTLRKL